MESAAFVARLGSCTLRTRPSTSTALGITLVEGLGYRGALTIRYAETKKRYDRTIATSLCFLNVCREFAESCIWAGSELPRPATEKCHRNEIRIESLDSKTCANYVARWNGFQSMVFSETPIKMASRLVL